MRKPSRSRVAGDETIYDQRYRPGIRRLRTAACFASRGHSVIGVDVDPIKLDLLSSGKAPVVEERIAEITADVVASGALTVSTDAIAAVLASDVSLVCVGTPSSSNGGLSTAYLERVSEQIEPLGGEVGAARRRVPEHDDSRYSA